MYVSNMARRYGEVVGVVMLLQLVDSSWQLSWTFGDGGSVDWKSIMNKVLLVGALQSAGAGRRLRLK